MSIEEKIYLAMVVIMVATFLGQLATLSWLDAKDARLRRRRGKARRTAVEPGAFVTGSATAHH